MSTQKQIDANRLNAQLSTGPRTAQGKRISSMNAFQSGHDPETQFVLGETREEFALLQKELYDYHAPATPDERSLVDKILRNDWFLRRFFRVEPQIWEYHSMDSQRGTGYELAEGYYKNNTSFNRFWRRQQTCEKNVVEARAELAHLVRERMAASAALAQAVPPPRAEISPAPPPPAPAAVPPMAGSSPAPASQTEESKAETPELGSLFTSRKTGQLTDRGFDLLAGILSRDLKKAPPQEVPEPEIAGPDPDEDGN